MIPHVASHNVQQWWCVLRSMPGRYLLLDVDGVLNPFAAAVMPDGYREHRYLPGLFWGPDGLRVWLHPGHGTLVSSVAARCGLMPVWATTWEQEANAWVAPRIGLPTPLEVIRFGGAGAYGKRPVVAAWAGERPLAWVDDHVTEEHVRWARERTAAGVPTLVVPIRPEVGLRPEDLDRVARWAA